MQKMNTLQALSLHVNIVSVQVCVQYRSDVSSKCENHWSVYLHTEYGTVIQLNMEENRQLEWIQKDKIPSYEIKILEYRPTTNIPQATNIAALVFSKKIETCGSDTPQDRCCCQSWV